MTGALVDLVLGVLVVEFVALLAFGRRIPRLPAFGHLLPNLAAGFFLVLALRVAVHEGAPAAIAACLALAGIAHACDLAVRRRGASS